MLIWVRLCDVLYSQGLGGVGGAGESPCRQPCSVCDSLGLACVSGPSNGLLWKYEVEAEAEQGANGAECYRVAQQDTAQSRRPKLQTVQADLL